MARGSWRRCPVTGLSVEKLKRQADEGFLRPDGSFNPEVRPDCNLFDIRSVSAALGYADHRYCGDVVLSNRPEGLNIEPLKLGPNLLLYPTHENSAAYWCEHHRPRTRAVSDANLRRGRPITDPSSGSGG